MSYIVYDELMVKDYDKKKRQHFPLNGEHMYMLECHLVLQM